MERDLPTARYWRRAALSMTEQILDTLKAALFDPTLPWPGVGEIAEWTAQLARWQRLDGPALVEEFGWWLRHHAGMTAAMVASAKRLERAQRRALLVYMKQTAPAAGKATA